MSSLRTEAEPSRWALAQGEFRSGLEGMLISLGPTLTMGLLAFAVLGQQGAQLGIPAALLCSAVGGLVFALLSRGPMPAAGPASSPVLVVGALVGSIAANPVFDPGDPQAVAALLALVATAVSAMGVFLILLSFTGLVRWAKFVPQPVLGGFMNGVALLALLALLPLMMGWTSADPQASWKETLALTQPATLAVGLFTVGVILFVPRLDRRLPATLTGLLVGSGAYYLLAVVLPQASLGPLTGALPAAWPQPDTLAPWIAGPDHPLLQQHGAAAVTAGLVMALIGTLELVLNSLAMDQACHTRTDPRRELLALGAANLASGLLGGLPLQVLRARALHMIHVGGRSRTGMFICCALFGVVALLAGPVLAHLPQVVLGGVMVTIAFLMADRWSLQLLAQWWRGVRTQVLQVELAVVALVCATTVVLGFPAAVAAGALLSVLLFIRSMNRSLVRNQFSGVAMPSRRIYAAADEARLESLRERITVLELEGAVFFGSADRIAERADDLDPACETLVLDFRRVSVIDASGAVVLLQVARRLRDRGITLQLAGVDADNRHGRMLREFVGEAFILDHGAADIDQAVEAAELRLLAREGGEPLRETVPLEQVSLMEGLDVAQRARLAAAFCSRRLAPGEVLFRTGDPGDRLFVITTGSITVSSGEPPAGGGSPQRFVSLSPGMMLGETAMLDGGGRSGQAVALGEAEVHSLDRDALQRVGEEDPRLRAQVYRNIALHLSQRLRAAAWAWRAITG